MVSALAGMPKRYLSELYEPFGKRVACECESPVRSGQVNALPSKKKAEAKGGTYNVKRVLPEQPFTIFPCH